MTKKQKKVLYRIVIAAVLLVLVSLLPLTGAVRLSAYMIPYLIIGYDILRKAAKGIWNREVFDENFLMAVATVGAILLGDYAEGTAVMLFYQIGELFQSYAVGKSRKNIAALMDIRPDYANIEDENGELTQVSPEEVMVDTLIVVRPGEKIPIDGVIVEGKGILNTGALTGESLPREAEPGDEVFSGCVNMSGLLKIKTTKVYEESTVSKILDLVENSSMKKARTENFISRFAHYYTPIVCLGAVVLAVLPPLVNLLFLRQPTQWLEWITRALTFLVISCPCALVISIPLSFFGGIGGASACGILIKGANYMEALAKADTVVFDKTGTLTKGVFEVTELHGDGMEDDTSLLYYAAHAESYSSHPISKSIVAAYKEKTGLEVCSAQISDVREIGGYGIVALVDGKEVAVGNRKLMAAIEVKVPGSETGAAQVYVAIDKNFAGSIVIADAVKEQSVQMVKELKANGVKRMVILTGDSGTVATKIGRELGIGEVYSELLPADKVIKVEELLTEKGKHRTVVFAGDGINDAPVLSRADVGIAMGAMGSDAAIEAADVVLMDDNPGKIVSAIKLSRKCMRIVYQNIVFALGVKGICLILGAFGIANMWIAIFADVGVMVIAVMNAIRCLQVKGIKSLSCE